MLLRFSRVLRQPALLQPRTRHAAALAPQPHQPWRATSSDATTQPGKPKVKTGIVMLNMGGPNDLEEVGPFLNNLFSDGEIINLGRFQGVVGPLMAKRRTPGVREQYAKIGGGSPIRRWTELQGQGMVERLDKLSPATGPHKAYTAFRYAAPFTEEALLEMKADGVERAVAFSQYPQYTCTTTGSSLNELWREVRRLGMENTFQWSLIDRWPLNDTFARAVTRRIELGLEQFDFGSSGKTRDDVVIMFSAHSLPQLVVSRGDSYAHEVAMTVGNVMQFVRSELGLRAPHLVSWQSKVGPLPWLVPKTGDMLKGLGSSGHKHVLVVPIAFTSDHIETLYEIDIEYGDEAREAGIEQFVRAPALNDEPLLMDALAEIATDHLKREELCSPMFPLRCPQCVNPDKCRTIVNPIKPYERMPRA